MEKQKNWYSVIQYIPNNLRGEKLNVGVMLHDPLIGNLRYQMLDVNNLKLRSLLANEVLQDTYRVQKECIEYYLEKLHKQTTIFDPNNYTNQFLEELNDKLPNGFILSEPTYSKTENPDRLLKNLMEMYIGNEFLVSTETFIQLNTKKYIKDLFEQKNLIGTKVKWNAKITPIKHIKTMHYTIDFVYKNGIINFLQAAPSNDDQLNVWFAKLKTILEEYERESNFCILYNKDDISGNDRTLKDMINFLKSKDQRVADISVNSRRFEELCKKIELEGKTLEEFEKELAV